MRALRRLFSLTLATLALFAAAPATPDAAAAIAAPSRPDGGRIVLLVVDRLSAPELFAALPQLPHLQAALAQGALGLLNTRAADRNPLSGFLSLGSGYHLVAPDGAGNWLPVEAPVTGMTAGRLYTSLTGQPAPAPGGYVWPGAAAFGRENRAAPTPPGGLGEALDRAGITPFVIGNADLPGSPRRGAALIVMDGAGRLAAAALEAGSRPGDAPYLVQDDPAALWAGAEQALATHRLVVVELGDLARLDDAELSVAPPVAARARERALQRLDAFLGDWLAGAQPNDGLLLVSPNPSAGDAARGHTLTATLWVEAGRNLHAALLTSATTHRAGLVANIDVAPTLLDRFGLEPPLDMAGAPIRSTPNDNARALLQRQYALIAATHDASPPVLKSYVLVAIAVFLFCGLWLALAGFGRVRAPGRKARRCLRGLLLAVQAFPLVLLLLPLAGPHPPWAAGLLAAGGALTLAGLGFLLGRGMTAFGWLALVTALALMIDVASGSRLMRFAILGYDAMGGARYYGIGNEFMGVLLGSAVAACSILHTRRPRLASLLGIVGFAAVTFWLGSPGLGANVGGAISAVVGLPLTLMLLARVRIRWPAVAGILVAVPLLLALAALADLRLHPASPSHLGRLAQRMATEGLTPLWHIGARKIALNLKLVRWTIWTRIFAVSLGAVIWLFTRPQAARPGAVVLAPALRRGVLGALLVSLVAFAANDSGIVAAATTMLPATVMLFAGLLTDSGEPGQKQKVRAVSRA